MSWKVRKLRIFNSTAYYIPDVFSEDVRNILLSTVKPLLQKVEKEGRLYPGLSSPSNLQEYDGVFVKYHQTFADIINQLLNIDVVFQKSWATYTPGDMVAFHTHPVENVLVYYLKNPDNEGTVYRDGNSVIQTPGDENSAILFSGNLLHTAPFSYVEMERYSMALNVMDFHSM